MRWNRQTEERMTPKQLAKFILKVHVCKNCKWFCPADEYFFCENERVPFVENGLRFGDEIEYWGCNQWESKDEYE